MAALSVVLPATAKAQVVIMRQTLPSGGGAAGGVSNGGGSTGSPASGPTTTPKVGTWTTSTAVASTPACSATAPAVRTVWCAGDDGSILPDADCAGARPSTSTTVADYGACDYARGTVQYYDAWSSGCASSATRMRHYDCQRSDGTTVPDDQCVSHGVALDETETAAVYDQCTYALTQGAWGPCSPDVRSRPTICTRSDGTVVAASNCGASATETQACILGPWTSCAAENGFCDTHGPGTVRYGANGSYSYKDVTDGIQCTNDIFGDPLYGTVKACDYQVFVAPTN